MIGDLNFVNMGKDVGWLYDDVDRLIRLNEIYRKAEIKYNSNLGTFIKKCIEKTKIRLQGYGYDVSLSPDSESDQEAEPLDEFLNGFRIVERGESR